MLAPEVEALWEEYWQPKLKTAKGWELAVDMDKVKQFLYNYQILRDWLKYRHEGQRDYECAAHSEGRECCVDVLLRLHEGKE